MKKNFKTILGLEFPKKIECWLSPLSHLILRVGFAILIMTHGAPKLFNFSTIVEAGTFPDPLGVGTYMSLVLTILAEFIAAIFLLLGLFTRIASFILFVTFFVIIFVVHAGDSFQEVEKAVMYFVIFIYFMLSGSTKQWSLDKLLYKKL